MGMWSLVGIVLGIFRIERITRRVMHPPEISSHLAEALG